MQNPSRNLLVLIRNQFMSEMAIQQEMKYLNSILFGAESEIEFCKAHEGVLRNRITSNPKKTLLLSRQADLKAFYFLINKN
jgi:hypothetical protein